MFGRCGIAPRASRNGRHCGRAYAKAGWPIRISRSPAATAGLPTASSLCGACSEVCPVQIPIPDLLVRLRTEAQRDPDDVVPHPLRGQGAGRDWRETLAWRVWRLVYAHPGRYRLFGWLATRLRRLTPARQGGWTRHRTPLQPAPHRLAELIACRQPRS